MELAAAFLNAAVLDHICYETQFSSVLDFPRDNRLK